MRLSASTWVLCLALLQGQALCQLQDSPAPANFLRRGDAKGAGIEVLSNTGIGRERLLTCVIATVIGNYLYIDGGEVSQLVDGKPTGGRLSNAGALCSQTAYFLPVVMTCS